MRASELQAITEEAVGPLERGLYEEVGITEFLGPELQLRYSMCGLASAALQRHLIERHNTVTTPVIINLPDGSPSMQSRHVFLRYAGHITIDPTYSQFFEYAGFSAVDASLDRSLTVHYPETKILVLEDQKADDFIADFAVRALQAGRAIGHPKVPSLGKLQATYRQIWKPETGKRFSVPQDAIVDRLVERMTTGQPNRMV